MSLTTVQRYCAACDAIHTHHILCAGLLVVKAEKKLSNRIGIVRRYDALRQLKSCQLLQNRMEKKSQSKIRATGECLQRSL